MISSRVSVLSGNRNFEGRIGPDIKANYLASPPLVVAYALAGSMFIKTSRPSLSARIQDGNPVYLKDIWPSSQEVRDVMRCQAVTPEMFSARYADVFKGDENVAGNQSVGRRDL